jgi:hypothetical protein
MQVEFLTDDASCAVRIRNVLRTIVKVTKSAFGAKPGSRKFSLQSAQERWCHREHGIRI